MRVYGSIYSAFWHDEKISSFSDDAKLLGVYLLTSDHGNLLGCFRLPLGYIAEDLSWTKERVTKALEIMQREKFIIYDYKLSWILICNYLKWNPLANPNQGKSLENLFPQVPNSSTFYRALLQSVSAQSKHLSDGFVNHLETLSKPFLNQEQDKEQDKYKEKEQEKGEQEKEGKHRRVLRHRQEESLEKNFETSPSTISPFPFVLGIPLRDGGNFDVSQALIDEWQALYDKVDVVQLLKNIRGWNLANPTKRKSKQGIVPHINQWLAKENARLTNPRILEKSSGFNLLEHNAKVTKSWLEHGDFLEAVM